MNKNTKQNLFFLREEYAEGEGVYISPEGTEMKHTIFNFTLMSDI